MYLPRGNPSKLLSGRFLQDQQMGLRIFLKVTISALSFGVCEIFCAPFKGVISVSGNLPGLSWNPIWPIKPDVLMAYLSSVGVLVWGVQCGALTSYLLEESLQLWFWFDYQGCSLDYTTFLPLLFPLSWLLLYIFSCRKSFCQLSIIVSKLYPESRSQNFSPIIF